MTNPLLAKPNASGGSGGGGPMDPGDIRVIHAKDNHGQITKTFTLERTSRPYVYDLCDAYNAARTRDDIEWYVTPAGELKIGEPREFTAKHTRELERESEIERDRWKRGQDRTDDDDRP